MELRTSSSTPAEAGLAGDHRQQTHQASWCCPAVEETCGYLRHTVRGALTKWELDSVIDAAELCVSELVTNSIIHAKNPDSAIELVLTLLGDRLRVNVSDATDSAPQLRTPDDEDEHGRGLMLVRDMSMAWGVDYTAGSTGKTVWCEIHI